MAMGKRANDENVGHSPVEPYIDIAAYPLAVPSMASIQGLVASVSLLAQIAHDPAERRFIPGVIAAIMGVNSVSLRFRRINVKAFWALGP